MSAVRTASGLREIVAIHFRDASNTLRAVTAGHARNAAGALKTFFSAMSASVPEVVSGFINKPTGADVTTYSIAVTVTGGTPTAYLWTRTDAGSDTWTITTPTAAETSFKAVGVASGDTRTASFKCHVTGSGGEADSNETVATAVNLGGGIL